MIDFKSITKPLLGPDCDVAVSSRVRLARNFADIPFPAKLSPDDRGKVVEIVNGAIRNDNTRSADFDMIPFDKLTADQMNALMENRIVSPDFIKSGVGRELIVNAKKSVFIMVNEEDHLRIQSIIPGFSLDTAFGHVNDADNIIDAHASYAFDENLGYLTHCPTNLGTGMRSSVMLHLPALSMVGSIRSIIDDISKVGLTIRGLYGEGTEAAGCLYQISNQITLGISEEQTLEKLRIIIGKIIDLERSTRANLQKNAPERLTDKIMRSYGILKHAHMIPSGEFFSLYSDIRFGAALGIIKDIDIKTIDVLLVDIMPHTLMLKKGAVEGEARDIARAAYIKETLMRINN